VPLAILRRDWQVTAIDGTRKKAEFVGRCAGELGLPNLRAIHAHARHWETADRFDVVALRAVGKLAEAIGTCHRFVTTPGWLVVYKTAELDKGEAEEGRLVARRAGLAEDVFSYEVSSGGGVLRRTLRVYERL
jgi:16S rRNA (guanine527-N7)-methyltransferase